MVYRDNRIKMGRSETLLQGGDATTRGGIGPQ